MKPRRILYITRISKGGVAVVLDQLARGLDRRRYEPIVLFDTNRQSHIRQKLSESDIKTVDLGTFHNQQLFDSPQPKKRRDIGAKVENHFGKSAANVYFSLKSFYQFLRHEAYKIRLYMRIIRENGIDLVHTHNDLNFGKPEIVAAWITGVPCISHNHAFYKLKYFDKIFSRFVDSFIYISNDIAKYHIAQGKLRSKGTVIHNGVNMSEFMKSYNTDFVRKEFSIKPEESIVGIIGRIDHWKGHEYFIEAMARAIKQIPALKGLIIGELETNVAVDRNRQYLNKLKLLIKSMDLEDKVIFIGFRDDVPRLLAALDVVVHASSTPEPFGLVVIEGMAAGKPVVATAAGGVLDIIEDGVNGMLIPYKDSKAMAQATLKLLFSQDEAKHMGLAARRSIVERFTVERQLRAVEKLYDSILGTPGHT